MGDHLPGLVGQFERNSLPSGGEADTYKLQLHSVVLYYKCYGNLP